MKHLHPLQFACILIIFILLSIARTGAQEAGPLAEPGPVAAPDTGSSASPDNSSSSSPFAAPGNGERPKNARTIIESEEGATFENATSTAEFTGHVVVNDPQFNLTCDKLHVILGPDRKGLAKAIATGSVVITQEKTNNRGELVKSIGKCGKATYVAATGDMTLEEWPQIQQGINNQVSTQSNTIMILNAKGRSRTIGGSRTMIVDQGTNAVTP
jgi:lipopolysaccharide export system protein LptA